MPVEIENRTESFEPESKRLCTMPVESILLRFAKLTEKAFTPTRGSKLAAGYDLYRYVGPKILYIAVLVIFLFLLP